MLEPLDVGAISGIVGKLRASHHFHQPTENRIGISADYNEVAVGAGVDIAGNSTSKFAASRLPNLSRAAVFQNDGIHQAQDGFGNGYIDFLTLPALFSKIGRAHV